MKQITFSTLVYSPRWGHKDRYEISLTENSIEVTANLNKATGIIGDKDTLVWSGYNDDFRGNPLIQIFKNDGIPANDYFIEDLEHHWQSWCAGVLNDEEVKESILSLFNGIDSPPK